jgi:AcrR family transcriptional regulator
MPRPAPKSTPRPEPGRARILQAGLDLAAESGPSGMTISRLCQRAGVKPPAIYYHFGSKEGLLGAVVETVAEAWLDQLEASQPAGSDIAARLRAAVDGWQAMIEDPARPIKLLLSVQLDGAEHSAEIEASLRRVYERARQLIAGSIRAAAGEVSSAWCKPPPSPSTSSRTASACEHASMRLRNSSRPTLPAPPSTPARMPSFPEKRNEDHDGPCLDHTRQHRNPTKHPLRFRQ